MASASSTSSRPAEPSTAKASRKRSASDSADTQANTKQSRKEPVPPAPSVMAPALPRAPVAVTAAPVHAVPTTSASSSASSSPHAKATRPLTFAHEKFASKTMVSGLSGAQPEHHAFTQSSFPNSAMAPRPAEAEKTYVAETGLEPIVSVKKPDWGVIRGPSRAGADRMYQSRRGSIVGLSDMPDGSIKGWRLHSLPTSEALRDQSTNKTFVQKFEERAALLSTSAVNTVGTSQSVNTVLSDVGKVRFNSTDGAFEWTDGSNAMGVSAKGLDKKASSSSAELFAPSRTSAASRKKKSMQAQTDHSEPMAVTFHNQARKVPMKDDTGLVGVFASFPNQVCAHCGEMFQDNIGKNSVVSGTPGRKFGGQKPGEVSTSAGSAVIRAHPMNELTADTTNRVEVANIAKYHSL